MHDIWLIIVIALVTAATRFVPFLLFSGKKEPPAAVLRLGRLLPCAIIGMLVVYCMKDIQPSLYPYGLPELIGCTAVALLHIWKRNSLLSIGVGTVLYMLLVQLVF
ncbi:MAG: branched-chain amino acid transporter permease [Oscillospiraceae bacterium]|nr:branched-chain amino acid transporter permease [Oscillospiraceae bacterium]